MKTLAGDASGRGFFIVLIPVGVRVLENVANDSEHC
jgi:hypothetical protein